ASGTLAVSRKPTGQGLFNERQPVLAPEYRIADHESGRPGHAFVFGLTRILAQRVLDLGELRAFDERWIQPGFTEDFREARGFGDIAILGPCRAIDRVARARTITFGGERNPQWQNATYRKSGGELKRSAVLAREAQHVVGEVTLLGRSKCLDRNFR